MNEVAGSRRNRGLSWPPSPRIVVRMIALSVTAFTWAAYTAGAIWRFAAQLDGHRTPVAASVLTVVSLIGAVAMVISTIVRPHPIRAQRRRASAGWLVVGILVAVVGGMAAQRIVTGGWTMPILGSDASAVGLGVVCTMWSLTMLRRRILGTT